MNLLKVLLIGAAVFFLAPGAFAGEHDETVANVVFEDQESDGDQIVIAQAELPEGGFIVMHDEQIADGLVEESITGVSGFLAPGSHTDVTVRLDPPITRTQVLLAMAHQDTNDNEVFDFDDSQGEDDGAYPDSDGGAVLDDGQVGISQGIPAPGVMLAVVIIAAALGLAQRRLR